LDVAAEEDAAAEVQIQALGQQLNAALARAAQQERLRAEAEKARADAEAALREELEERQQELERYRSEFFGQLVQLLEGREGVRIEGDRFVFSSEVLFEVGEAELSDPGRDQIARVVSILRDVSDQIPENIDWVLRVDGHTDSAPIRGGRWEDNWELSQARALSVVRFMIDELGFPPERLAATGFGQWQPIAEGDTPEARAQNRRIELKLTEK
ncbi:OmpA family protein, partial [Psychromarinibacter sp. C21-152]